MPVLAGQNLRKSYGQREILAGVSVTVDAGERIGLVGVNGSGKTTLARILAGIEEPDDGELTRSRGVSLAYLSQNPDMNPKSSVLDVALSGLTEWSEAMARHEAASGDIAAGTGDMAGLLSIQADAVATIERTGGWDLGHQAKSILGHLGVTSLERPVGAMSGGERRRVAMARLLVSRPDVAVLDEPTNHLDIPTIQWLEQFLIERFTGAMLLITHDRYLLDRVVTRTLELDHGELFSYDGGWEDYLAAHAERVAQSERVESNRRNFLRRELDWLRRQPKARTGKQKARIARAHAVIDADGPVADGVAKIKVGTVRAGKSVLGVRNLMVDIGGARLVDDLTLTLNKGERIGIVGPNGAGKTTLLRVLLGDLEPAGGTVTVGKNTRVAYLDQSRAGLDDKDSVYDNVAGSAVEVTLGETTMAMRTYLYRFLFDNEAQKQLVGTLSGGERARVALARVLREAANLIVLDEPTNDLDVTTLAVLEASLLDSGGTALVVTHDRWFLDRVATSILAFEDDGRVVHVHGTYADYLAWRELDRADDATPVPERTKPSAAESGPKQPKNRRSLTYGERIELDGLMDKIDAAEAEVATLEAELNGPSFAVRSYTDQAAYLEDVATARAKAEALVDRWSDLESRKE